MTEKSRSDAPTYVDAAPPPDPDAVHLPPGTRLGPYEVVAPIGAGGMGVVFRAWDDRLQRAVAIKLVSRSFAAHERRLLRFEQEMRAAAAISHPNVVAVFDVGAHEGSPFLVTELLDGRTLRARLDAGSLEPSEALEIAVQIARGLVAAHGKGVVHRDLKPENVVITAEGIVKIVDFGLARLRHAEDVSTSGDSPAPARGLTEDGAVLGTAGYMAPEQVRGLAVDNRADIFSFGCLLYEMLAGRRAFSGRTHVETMMSVLREDPLAGADAPALVPPELWQIGRRCLEKEPADRYASAVELAQALAALRGDTATGMFAAAPPRRRRAVLGLVAAGLVVGALAALGLVLRGDGDALPSFRPRQVTNGAGFEGEPALSPDGRSIAYVADIGGRFDLWLAAVDGGQPRRLTSGPERERAPAWLPDGSAVAFVAERAGRSSIWRVSRAGGPAVLLADDAVDPALAPDGRSLAFARFAKGGVPRLFVAALAEPAGARVFTSAPAQGLWGQRDPAWSPDSRRLCFTGDHRLRVAHATGGEARQLTDSGRAEQNPVWSADGRFVYFDTYREDTRAIWRVRASGGTPERVTLGSASEEKPSVDRDGRHLAYGTRADRAALVLFDPAGGEAARFEEARMLGAPALVPDGSAVVFASNRDNALSLWRLELEGGRPAGEPRRLTDGSGSDSVPCVSPDGRWIAFQRVVGNERDILVMPAGGGAAQIIAGSEGAELHPAWSPDGRRLAFVSDRGGALQVWTVAVEGGRPAGEPRLLAAVPGDAGFPRFLADGEQIAFVVTEDDRGEVWLASLTAPSPPRRLTSGAHARRAVWDNRTRNLLVLGTWEDPIGSIRAVPLDGGSPRVLADWGPDIGTADITAFDLAADGRLAVVLEATSRGDVWLLEAERGRF